MQEQQKELTYGQQINLVVVICQILRQSLLPFTRIPGTFGKRFCGLQGVIAVLGLPCFIDYADRNAHRAQVAFFALMGAWFVHAVAEKFRKEEPHSLDPGISWFVKFLGYRLGCVVEVVLPVVIGYFVRPWSPGIGGWLMAAGIGLAVDNAYQTAWRRSETRAIHDARIRQEALRRAYEEDFRHG